MLSESVDQKPIIAVTLGTNTGQKSPNDFNLPESFKPEPSAEQSARDDRAHDGRHVGAEDAVARTREDGEGDAVLRSGMRVREDRNEDDDVADEDRDERLPPVHARADEARREHVRRDAINHQ